jgi:hypothetical protein
MARGRAGGRGRRVGLGESFGEASAHGLQSEYLGVNAAESSAHDGDRVAIRARGQGAAAVISRGEMEVEKPFDFAEGETEHLRPTNEADAVEIGFRVGTVVGSSALRLTEQGAALVKPSGLDVDAGAAGEFSDAHGTSLLKSQPYILV